MNKLTLAVAALVIGLGTASATAMPVDNLAGVGTGLKVDQVRIVCNAWGRCWRPNYYYGAYGYIRAAISTAGGVGAIIVDGSRGKAAGPCLPVSSTASRELQPVAC